ncbi:SRPBCC family protein [Bacillus suaedaesalsae]|uniref:SRPBCC family protein n=1 Tax=Bacillus suaedaesalsae TaxID=2810349 RepID=A0ABS2DND5_9BACI|nr:SRPBCC family protein [Bacillus suaedaesalsae]MBM6619001.1 SRPBCC family protein [Bacillus suaedaesalsae]
MKQWTRDTEIHAPIEQVWKLFDGSLEDMQKIMPQVIENKLVTETENKVGSVHLQTYKERNRTQTYEVKTLEYMNQPDHKIVKVGFVIANMFEITARYELKKLEDNKTWFQYTTTNKPLKWFIKAFLLLASDKIVVQFVDRVKRVAEEQNEAGA